MPTPIVRQSLTTDLATRYETQRAGGAFNVQQTLSDKALKSGNTINATSFQGKKFQSPNGFEVKDGPGGTQFLDAQGTTSKQLSIYMKGFSDVKYDA